MDKLVKSNPAMKKMFNSVKKYNSYFNEMDSISLNTLVFNLYYKEQNEQHLFTLHLEDDQYERYMTRIEKFNKQITESMKQLCIPLTSRVALSNDMTKVVIEEKKLEEMNEVPMKKVNPLLEMLEENDND